MNGYLTCPAVLSHLCMIAGVKFAVLLMPQLSFLRLHFVVEVNVAVQLYSSKSCLLRHTTYMLRLQMLSAERSRK